MFLKTSASILFLLLCASQLRAADPVRLLIAAGNSGEVLEQAAVEFAQEHGPGLIELEVGGPVLTPEQVRRADLIYWDHPDEANALELSEALETAVRLGTVVGVGPAQMVPRRWTFVVDQKLVETASLYLSFGGSDNLAAMLAYFYEKAGGRKKIAVPLPVAHADAGIYHPRTNREFASLSEYLEWYRAQGIVASSAPLVAVTFFQTNLRNRDLAHINALIAELESNGIGAVAAFGWPFNTLDPLLTIDGKSPLRLILALNLSTPTPGDTVWLEKHGVHALNLQVSQQSYAEWSEGMRGLTPDAVSHQVAAPERAATAEPILIATTETAAGSAIRKTQPVAERVAMAVSRAKRWIALQDKPNAEKRVVFVYYNNPPGKGNLGASYLQILPTMATLLRRLQEEGYTAGNPLPDGDELKRVLERSGRNIETWAPGELQAMLDAGGMTLFAVDDYKRHFAQLPRQFQEMVTKEYGPPEKAELLRIRSRDGKDYFLIPGVRYGNFFLGVQPMRSTMERAISTTHDTAIPVPHSYIAAYLWYRHVFKADAIVHIGRHGTLEWLPGKQVMQASWDHSEALLGDVPNPYVYIMDGDGEALQAMRRSAAVNMSHLTPLIVPGGEQKEMQALKLALENWADKRETQPELAVEYQSQAIAEARRLKLDEQLGVSLDDTAWPTAGERMIAWVNEVQDGPIPAGIHSLGHLPDAAVQREALQEFLRFGFQEDEIPLVRAELTQWADAIFDGDEPSIAGSFTSNLRDKIQTHWAAARQWLDALRASPAMEVDALAHVLAGRYLPSSPLGDPLRTPHGLPTGRKQFGFDPTLIPTKAAWDLGRKMADETLERYVAEHGEFPEKVSMVLWYGETERHHGAMESMAMDLMGVEVLWNARGQVDDLRLVPDSEMRHPRVDVVFNISGIYRDGFGDKIVLLDRAVRLAASAGTNAISKHDAQVTEVLVAQGVERKQAELIARARVFGNKPGAYNIGVNDMVEMSRDVDDPEEMANLYLHNMNYAYTRTAWGETAPKALATHLEGNQAVLFSRTSNLYAALDNDDVYSYVGGLNFATKQLNGGDAPAFYIHNLRKPGSESAVDLKTWLATELNQRNWNPKWIEHMKASGYAGAREMNREIQHLYGFQATSSEHVDGTFWQNTFDVYVADKYGMDLKAFFERENAHARQDVLARLLEVDRQGSYEFSQADRDTLVREYVESVIAHGVACSANICGNQRLQQAVASAAATVSGLGQAELRQFGQVLAKATGWNVSEFRSAPAAFRAGMQAAKAPTMSEPQLQPQPEARPNVEGFAMEEKIVKLAEEAAATLPIAWQWAVLLFAIMLAGAAWEARRSARISTRIS